MSVRANLGVSSNTKFTRSSNLFFSLFWRKLCTNKSILSQISLCKMNFAPPNFCQLFCFVFFVLKENCSSQFCDPGLFFFWQFCDVATVASIPTIVNNCVLATTVLMVLNTCVANYGEIWFGMIMLSPVTLLHHKTENKTLTRRSTRCEEYSINKSWKSIPCFSAVPCSGSSGETIRCASSLPSTLQTSMSFLDYGVISISDCLSPFPSWACLWAQADLPTTYLPPHQNVVLYHVTICCWQKDQRVVSFLHFYFLQGSHAILRWKQAQNDKQANLQISHCPLQNMGKRHKSTLI